MSSHTGRFSRCGVYCLCAALALLAAQAHAAITPISNFLTATAYSQVANSPFHSHVTHQDTHSPPGNYSASAADSVSDSGLSCSVTVDNTSHLSADGASGSADFSALWVPNNPAGSGSFGEFDAEAKLFYSFILSDPTTLVIDCDLALSGNLLSDVNNSNFHTITVKVGPSSGDNQYYNINIGSHTHIEVPLTAGVRNFEIDDVPNGSLFPWPDGTETITNHITFSLGDVPEPASLALLASAGLLIALGRRAAV